MSEQSVRSLDLGRGARVEVDFHLLDLLVVLARRRYFVLAMAGLCGIAGLIAALVMSPTYSSTARILPPQQQQSSGMAAMLGQLGGLAGAAGGLASLKSPGDMYVGMLESRTLADRLIGRFKLQERYGKSTMDDTRRLLSEHSDIASGKKDGFISINVSDRDPAFAASLANAYVEELDKMTQSMALTDASKRRVFFEKQLKDASEQLASAEVALRGTQERTGLIQADAQVRAIISTVAQLKGAIAAKEVQLNSLRTFATGKNPETLRTLEELRSLRAQLDNLEKDSPSRKDDFALPVGKIPQIGVEYARSLRNVKYYETIYELLAKQFELAKLEEAKDASLIQLLDKAVPAERKSKPRTVLILIAGLFVGTFLGILWVLIHAGFSMSRSNPANSDRWQQLSDAWRVRKA
jgi:tyrosine-protein kinase Etk/Wzc